MITTIVRPKSVPEAVREKTVPGSAWLGGGTWLASAGTGVTRLISLESLGLATIEAGAESCVIGSMATFQQIVDDARVPAGLREAARILASRTLRNMCTLGGELGLRADDSALIPMLMALGATVSRAGARRPAPIQTWLEKPTDGLVLSVSVPRAECAVTAVSRTSHSPRSVVVAAALVGSKAAVAAAREGPSGKVAVGDRRGRGGEGGPVALEESAGKVAVAHEPSSDKVAIVVSDCRGTRLMVSVARGSERSGVESVVSALFSPKPDIHASAEYKRYIAGVVAADLVARL